MILTQLSMALCFLGEIHLLKRVQKINEKQKTNFVVANYGEYACSSVWKELNKGVSSHIGNTFVFAIDVNVIFLGLQLFPAGFLLLRFDDFALSFHHNIISSCSVMFIIIMVITPHTRLFLVLVLKMSFSVIHLNILFFISIKTSPFLTVLKKDNERKQ